MILNLGSLAFNANIQTSGGTPAWGTELGQGDGYKFSFEDMSDFFTGMVYKAISDTENVTCPLGKGGNQRADYDFVIASIFDKIYVNGQKVSNASFLLLIVKKLIGDHHVGRRTIKYNPRMTYQGKCINDDCFKKIATTMGLPDNAAWFVYEIFIINQDELHFTAFELGSTPQIYKDNEERKKAFINKLTNGNRKCKYMDSQSKQNLQQIFYGAPGTGKSNTIKREVDDKGKLNFRTTFHPDSDYSTFVGCYKPTMKRSTITKDDVTTTEEKIVYKFEPQAFTNAYVQAWNSKEDVYLIIEEINRGNCAQIFGDLFQLLDRKNGESEYPVNAESALADYLSIALSNTDRDDIPFEVKNGTKLKFPSNLYIWATMNTSDQSLFPIDSAFKRRWDWKYMKIKDEGKNWKIDVKTKNNDGEDVFVDWWNFIRKINEIIASMTSSADKQLGYFFCKADKKTQSSNNENDLISMETLVNKVLFYLWNDVFKDYGFEDASLFQYDAKTEDGKDIKKDMSFPDFYEEDSNNVNSEMVTDFVLKVMNWRKNGEENN